MKPDLSLYLKDIYRVLDDETVDNTKEKIQEIFDDLEAEIGFLDERRQESEDALQAFMKALAEQQREKEISNS
jgi:hypothetical protein